MKFMKNILLSKRARGILNSNKIGYLFQEDFLYSNENEERDGVAMRCNCHCTAHTFHLQTLKKI